MITEISWRMQRMNDIQIMADFEVRDVVIETTEYGKIPIDMYELKKINVKTYDEIKTVIMDSEKSKGKSICV